MNTDKLLARMTAQSSGPNPKEPGGGVSELTASDISLIASHAPPLSWHALMVKCCHDKISLRELIVWAHDVSLTEWFLNPANENANIKPGQVNRLVELSIIGWFNPQAKEVATVAARSAYIRAVHNTYKNVYQAHYAFLTGELGYVEAVGRMAIKRFQTFD